jgi:hypothetical protein
VRKESLMQNGSFCDALFTTRIQGCSQFFKLLTAGRSMGLSSNDSCPRGSRFN